MNNTWIDVSHIMNWKGGLTGIERVEYHVISYYYRKKLARFIYFNSKDSRFVELDRKSVRKQILDRTSEKEMKADRKSLLDYYRKRSFSLKSLSRKALSIDGSKVIILAGLWDNESYIEAVRKMAQHNELTHIVYDMIPIVRPEFVVSFLPRVFENYMTAVLPNCHEILAISESTANDTAKVLKSKKLKVPAIKTFRLGDDIPRGLVEKRPNNVPDKFILSVGTIEVRKNHKLLYKAQHLIREKYGIVVPIVIAGKRGWMSEDFQSLAAQPNSGLVILDKATDSEIKWLYKNCMFTVFPSFYEGWGLPVTESLNYKKVTLCSNTSSMPEAGSRFADYFSPNSAKQLSILMTSYIDDKKRKAREKYIRANYKPTVWDKAVKQFTLKIN